MKRILFFLLALGVFTFFACNNEAESNDDAGGDEATTEEAVDEVSGDDAVEAEVAMVEHACGDLCAHHYAHGEEGHVCDDACPPPVEGAVLSEHMCSTDCMHHLAHGEEGHVCGEECGVMDDDDGEGEG
ncbi:MAG: hypothetical protein IIA45_00220 [Bacteroidetes bacterium]|nr:hypothetical protein [Bacteroidota bacterium]